MKRFCARAVEGFLGSFIAHSSSVARREEEKQFRSRGSSTYKDSGWYGMERGKKSDPVSCKIDEGKGGRGNYVMGILTRAAVAAAAVYFTAQTHG